MVAYLIQIDPNDLGTLLMLMMFVIHFWMDQGSHRNKSATSPKLSEYPEDHFACRLSSSRSPASYHPMRLGANLLHRRFSATLFNNKRVANHLVPQLVAPRSAEPKSKLNITTR